MRVIFLGSAYFGYVYTYAFNPSALSNSADALAQQEWRELMGDEESRPTPKPTHRCANAWGPGSAWARGA